MAKNRRVKGFCAECGDPVVTGGKQYGGKWYHNPCFMLHTYGMPRDTGETRTRRSAPPRRRIREWSEEERNPVDVGSGLEILAHAKDVTFAMNPAGGRQMYYVWEGPLAAHKNIVRFPTYNQANQYYRDVIDGKMGISKNPKRIPWKPILIAAGVIGAIALVVYLYKKNTAVQKAVKDFSGKLATSAVAAGQSGAQSGNRPQFYDGFGAR